LKLPFGGGEEFEVVTRGAEVPCYIRMDLPEVHKSGVLHNSALRRPIDWAASIRRTTRPSKWSTVNHLTNSNGFDEDGRSISERRRFRGCKSVHIVRMNAWTNLYHLPV
jgi:hypothetical protein